MARISSKHLCVITNMQVFYYWLKLLIIDNIPDYNQNKDIIPYYKSLMIL